MCCTVSTLSTVSRLRYFQDIFSSKFEVDPTSDSVIDLRYPVGGEEHHPLIVFQGPQEHADESISMDILNRALFEKYIRLIQKEDCLQSRGTLEDTRQSLFDGLCRCAKLASRDLHEWPLKMFGDQLSCQGLPYTGWSANTTCQQDHDDNGAQQLEPSHSQVCGPFRQYYFEVLSARRRRIQARDLAFYSW